MNVATRLATFSRAVIPYASFFNALIVLGYAGYNIYSLYNIYLAQVERDRRFGVERSFEETIELVVRPRRRRLEDEISQDDEYRSASGARAERESSDENSGRPIAIDSNNMLDGSERPELINGGNCSNTRQEGADLQVLYELQSNASTDLESTDSTRGVVRDLYNECFVCAQTLNDPQKEVATLPFCVHPFHKKCLDSIIKWHQRCPVCDCNIFSPI